jgi:hypothetical protein
VDSFLAITFVTAVVLLALFNLSNVRLDAWNSIDLLYATNDMLTVLEKSGTLNDSFELNSFGDEIIIASDQNVLNYLNNSSHALCFELTVFGDGNLLDPIFYVIEDDCLKESVEVTVVERPFVIVKGDIIEINTVQLSGWRK